VFNSGQDCSELNTRGTWRLVGLGPLRGFAPKARVLGSRPVIRRFAVRSGGPHKKAPENPGRQASIVVDLFCDLSGAVCCLLMTGESLIATQALQEAPTPPIAALQPLDATPMRRRGCRHALGGTALHHSSFQRGRISGVDQRRRQAWVNSAMRVKARSRISSSGSVTRRKWAVPGRWPKPVPGTTTTPVSRISWRT